MRDYKESAAMVGVAPGMVGVVTRPDGDEASCSSTGVVLLGAGVVHHVGPNRLMVRLARRLAEHGLISVRFDHRGIGDSGPRYDGRAFDVASVGEACEVMDWLAREEGLRSFVLLGICSGAETAMRAALTDHRISGAVMINGGGQATDAQWDFYEAVRGEARIYLKRSMFSLDSWVRAFTGRIQYRRLFGILLAQLRNRLFPPEQVADAARRVARDLESLIDREVHLLLVQSERDRSQDYFDTMFGKDAARFLDSDQMQVEVIPFVDHEFVMRRGQVRLLDLVDQWLAGHFGGQGAAQVEANSRREASS